MELVNEFWLGIKALWDSIPDDVKRSIGVTAQLWGYAIAVLTFIWAVYRRARKRDIDSRLDKIAQGVQTLGSSATFSAPSSFALQVLAQPGSTEDEEWTRLDLTDNAKIRSFLSAWQNSQYKILAISLIRRNNKIKTMLIAYASLNIAPILLFLPIYVYDIINIIDNYLMQFHMVGRVLASVFFVPGVIIAGLTSEPTRHSSLFENDTFTEKPAAIRVILYAFIFVFVSCILFLWFGAERIMYLYIRAWLITMIAFNAYAILILLSKVILHIRLSLPLLSAFIFLVVASYYFITSLFNETLPLILSFLIVGMLVMLFYISYAKKISAADLT